MTTKQKESELKSAIISTLNFKQNTFGFSVASTGIPNMKKVGGKYQICGLRKNKNAGISDIIGCKNGRFFAMEVKIKTDLRPDQIKFLESVNIKGKGYECVVRSVDDSLEAWKEV